MNLWIRSQDKKELIKSNRIYQYAGTIYAEAKEDIELGNYKSRERALEVLDEIQDVLKPQQYEVPTGRGTFTTSPNISNYVYEMPKD